MALIASACVWSTSPTQLNPTVACSGHGLGSHDVLLWDGDKPAVIVGMRITSLPFIGLLDDSLTLSAVNTILALDVL